MGENSKVVYSVHGRDFKFNDPIEVTCVMLPLEERLGRIVQVRKGVGAFGSDVLLIRKLNGSLGSFENVGLSPVDECLSRYEFPAYVGDSTEQEYLIVGQFPEMGFVIESPAQPKSESPAFGITITHGS